MRRASLYRGPYLDAAPDLIIGYNEGYRTSWDAAVGKVTPTVISDNPKAWSGDHCVDPVLVPGVLFCSRQPRLQRPRTRRPRADSARPVRRRAARVDGRKAVVISGCMKRPACLSFAVGSRRRGAAVPCTGATRQTRHRARGGRDGPEVRRAALERAPESPPPARSRRASRGWVPPRRRRARSPGLLSSPARIRSSTGSSTSSIAMPPRCSLCPRWPRPSTRLTASRSALTWCRCRRPASDPSARGVHSGRFSPSTRFRSP